MSQNSKPNLNQTADQNLSQNPGQNPSRDTGQAAKHGAGQTTRENLLQTLQQQGLVKHGQVWRGFSNRHSSSLVTGVKTGYPQLDQRLTDGGWPNQGLMEIIHDQTGLGELRLFAPALASLSQTQNRWIVWVAPPYIPYAPALSHAGIDLRRLLVVNPAEFKDQLWVIEKALSSGSCSAVMAWPRSIQYKHLRRLQVAGKNGGCLGVLYRQIQATGQPSPAELRLRLSAHQDDSAISDNSVINLQILKRKGGSASEVFPLELQDQLNQTTPDFSELQVQQWQQNEPDLVYMERLEQDQHVLQ